MTTDILRFTPNEIKKVTPFLDKPEPGKDGPPVVLSPKERAFCWFFVHEGNNATNAYIRAFNMTMPDNTVLHPTQAPSEMRRRASQKCYMLKQKADVMKAIALIFEHTVHKETIELQDTMIGRLAIQATYDPAMFFSMDGSPAFNSWNEIPPRYRCCVKELKTEVHGRDGDVRIKQIKLVDQMVAMEKYFKLTGEYPAAKLELTGRDGGPVAFERSGEPSNLSEEDQLTVLAILRGGSQNESSAGGTE